MEPVLPKPHLLIYGRSPIAIALATLAQVVGYKVERHETPTPTSDATNAAAIVVVTQGEDDEGAMQQALRQNAYYTAFVASHKKWEAVRQYLHQAGIEESRLNAVNVPAGIDIGATSPEEIAVSIVAQIIEARRKKAPAGLPVAAEPVTSVDPVCGMAVNVARAKHVTTYRGNNVYFCCAPCKTAFDKDPAQYVSTTA